MHIVKPVSAWVIVTFFLFVLYGLTQVRTRQVTAARLIVLPALTALLTFASVVTGIPNRTLGLLAWLAGIVLVVWLGKLIRAPRGLRYSYQTKLISVPGSWVPLFLLLLIYIMLYTVSDITGNSRVLVNFAVFSTVVGLVYGAICGMFLARMLAALRVKRRRINNLIS